MIYGIRARGLVVKWGEGFLPAKKLSNQIKVSENLSIFKKNVKRWMGEICNCRLCQISWQKCVSSMTHKMTLFSFVYSPSCIFS